MKNLGPPPYESFQEGMVWRMLGITLLEQTVESIMKNIDMAAKVVSMTEIEAIRPEWQQKSITIASTMWKELIFFVFEEKIKNISIPLLAITGAKDIMVPFRILKKDMRIMVA